MLLLVLLLSLPLLLQVVCLVAGGVARAFDEEDQACGRHELIRCV